MKLCRCDHCMVVELGPEWRDKLIEKEKVKKLDDAAEMLWVVLANVSEGNWDKQDKPWQKAAAKWRDNYFKVRKGLKLDG